MINMTFKKLLQSIMCGRLVFFEDDFQCNSSEYKNSVIFSLIRMDRQDRDSLLKYIKEGHEELYGVLLELCEQTDKYYTNINDWNGVVRNDVKGLFQAMKLDEPQHNQLLEIYDSITDSRLKEIENITFRFGLGVIYPADYEDLYEEYIWTSPLLPSIRIYGDFSSKEKDYILEDLSSLDDDKTLVCIIDNNLEGVNRAQSIINSLQEDISKIPKSVIGAVYSSKGEFEVVNEFLHFEYISKSESNCLKGGLARSGYSYFLHCLKNNTLNKIENAFNTMLCNKLLAQNLAEKANLEGESEYAIISELLRLLCKPTKESEDSILKLVRAAHIINALDYKNQDEEEFDISLEIYNTLEAFDFSINRFLQPPQVGDIFRYRNDYYVLIGQDCDMSWRGNGKKPRNALYEMLKISLLEQKEFGKWSNDQKKVYICNFKESLNSNVNYICSIDYQKRKYISKEVLSLCSYNFEGKCELEINEELSEEIIDVIPQYLINYHNELQMYYKSLKKIKESLSEELNIVTEIDNDSRILNVSDFETNDNTIIYPLTRVCRLEHEYVYYLYRLYLEYRGRQPFQTINLVGRSGITLPIYYKGRNSNKSVSIICVEMPLSRGIGNLPWIILKENIKDFFESENIDCDNLPNVIVIHDRFVDLNLFINNKKKKVRLCKHNKNLEIKVM